MRTCFLYVLNMIENVCQLSIIKKNHAAIGQLSINYPFATLKSVKITKHG